MLLTLSITASKKEYSVGLERLLLLQEQSDLGIHCNFFGEASNTNIIYKKKKKKQKKTRETTTYCVMLAKVTQLRVFIVYNNV